MIFRSVSGTIKEGVVMVSSKSCKIVLCVLLLLCVSGSIFAFGHDGSEDLPDTEIMIGPYAEYLQDSSKTLTFEELSRGDRENDFLPHEDEVFTFGISRNAYWIRFSVKDVLGYNDLFNPGGTVLFYDYSGIERIDIHLPVVSEGDEEYITYRGGYFYRGLQDELGHFFPVFELPDHLDPERPIYTRVESQYSNNFSMGISNGHAFFSGQQSYTFLLALAYGIMIAMILYNFVLYIAIKDRPYILYVGYMVFMLIYQVGVTGILKVLDFRLGELLEYYVIAATFAALIFALLFSRAFLQIDRYVPKARPVIYGALAFCGVGIILVFAGQQYYANYMAYVPGAFLPFFVMTVALISYRRGNRIARYYILATAVLFTAVVLFVLRGIGVVEHSFFTSYALTMSTSIESLLLSFALADRIRHMRQNQEVAEKREIELSRISMTDSLTGLHNRRYFDELVPVLLKESHFSRIPLSLVYLDIDNFKKFNDTYGHPMGDKVLQALAKVVRENIREADLACRIGGEEFSVIFPSTGAQEAERVAERIRKSFEEFDFSSIAQEIPRVTISIGVTTGKIGESEEDLICRTDRALYRAKAEGKNRVVADTL